MVDGLVCRHGDDSCTVNVYCQLNLLIRTLLFSWGCVVLPLLYGMFNWQGVWEITKTWYFFLATSRTPRCSRKGSSLLSWVFIDWSNSQTTTDFRHTQTDRRMNCSLNRSVGEWMGVVGWMICHMDILYYYENCPGLRYCNEKNAAVAAGNYDIVKKVKVRNLCCACWLSNAVSIANDMSVCSCAHDGQSSLKWWWLYISAALQQAVFSKRSWAGLSWTALSHSLISLYRKVAHLSAPVARGIT